MDSDRWQSLQEIYEDVADIDLYVGGLSERPAPEAVVGPTFGCIIGTQFERLKFGDRFFYDHANQAGSFKSSQLKEIKKTTLAGIICNNGDNFGSIQAKPLDLVEYVISLHFYSIDN